MLADESGHEPALLLRDALTGLPGREALVLRLGELLARREPAALLLVQVEDAAGVGGGAPDVLRAVARVLGELAQPGELVARALGRELACVLPGADAGRGLAAARRARAQLVARGLADGGRLPVAIAIAVLEAGAEDAEGVLRRASRRCSWPASATATASPRRSRCGTSREPGLPRGVRSLAPDPPRRGGRGAWRCVLAGRGAKGAWHRFPAGRGVRPAMWPQTSRSCEHPGPRIRFDAARLAASHEVRRTS